MIHILRSSMLGFMLLISFLPAKGQNTGDFRSNGNVNFTSATNWQRYNGASWVAAAAAPTGSDGQVTIRSGNTATVASSTTVKSLDILGNINLSDGSQLTVNGNITIEASGNFSMPGGSGNATLIVYGDYTNYGLSDFWKSDVIVAGNFISPDASGVQNQGNIIVGGNFIGNIDLTGGTGSSQLYSLNPNAVVNITPGTLSYGTTISSPPESATLVNIINTVIYGGASPCGFTINGPINTTSCSGGNATFSISSTTATTPTYQWEENRGAGWASLANGGVYSSVKTANLTLTAAPAGMDGYIYRCKVTDNSSCSKYSYSATLTVSATAAVGTPVFVAGTTSTRCKGAGSVVYTANASNTTGVTYSLDAASVTGGNTINASTGSVTYVAGWSGTSVITASAAGCGGPLSATHTVTISPLSAVSVSISVDNNSVCTGCTVNFVTNPVNGGTTPAYQWMKNAVNIGGANSSSYSYLPVNNDIIVCVLTSNIACPSGNPATSNSITMIVKPKPNAGAGYHIPDK